MTPLRVFPAVLALAASSLFALPPVAGAQEQPAGGKTAETVPEIPQEKPAPYDGRLERLSEVLGAVHYLRNLCLEKKEDGWRRSMEELIAAEARDEPQRRARLTAAFNRGYRSFASVYTSCTQPAIVAEGRYRNEGATLASEIAARFGN
ncbi:TIGR02301 family protein [Rhizobium sp. TRM95111]|uniref:TIGR02301 family protein n=1 Tax=Rhizobium alarense TaxID=2846851 RepID=UPI001F312763|nr:TIGR02301 family protein [Rhizobium alarense]MCF3641551.1 TIGR02301 family protein [Rhizobium alarense]